MMKQIPIFKVEEDLSQKDLEYVKITPLPDGYFNLHIYARTKQSGSGYIITLSRNQLNQLKEAVKQEVI